MMPGFGTGGDCLQNARSGSPIALGQLLQSCVPYLHFIIAARLRRDHSPSDGTPDLIQETHLRVLRGFDDFKGTTENQFLAWVRRILLNVLADHRIALKRLPGQLPRKQELPDLKTASWLAEQAEHAAAVARALAGLTADHRRVLMLRHDKECTWEVIGRRLRCTPEAVRKIHVRALRTFTRLAKDLDPRS